jgi:hypothetical protein
MRRGSVLAMATCTVASATLATTALAAPALDAPPTARIGAPLVIRASGGLTPRLYYRATFTQGAGQRVSGRECSRNIDQGFRSGTSTGRVYRWRGRVPRTLACYDGGRRFVIRTSPGRYVIVVGHKTGKTSWDTNAVTLRRSIQITR